MVRFHLELASITNWALNMIVDYDKEPIIWYSHVRHHLASLYWFFVSFSSKVHSFPCKLLYVLWQENGGCPHSECGTVEEHFAGAGAEMMAGVPSSLPAARKFTRLGQSGQLFHQTHFGLAALVPQSLYWPWWLQTHHGQNLKKLTQKHWRRKIYYPKYKKK